MTAFIIRRLLALIPTLLAVYTITFLVAHATPGSPWDESEKPLPAAVKENLKKQYHLDDPLYKQYLDYLFNALQGDFGPSYRNVERSASEIIRATFPISVQLGLVSLLFALLIGIPMGTLAALKQNTWVDYLVSLITVTGVATPPFVRITLLIVLFSITVRWFPTGGWNGIFDSRIILPTVALGIGPAAILARYVRSSLLEVLHQDYMRTAKAKGLRPFNIITKHALKNAMIPVVTVIGVTLTNVVTGAFFVEQIYDVPGIGRQFVSSVLGRDYPMILAITLLFALIVLLMNLLVDLSYGFLDPRVRYQ